MVVVLTQATLVPKYVYSIRRQVLKWKTKTTRNTAQELASLALARKLTFAELLTGVTKPPGRDANRRPRIEQIFRHVPFPMDGCHARKKHHNMLKPMSVALSTRNLANTQIVQSTK